MGIGLVVVFGGGMGVGAEVGAVVAAVAGCAAALAARFETIWSEYVGYGPGPRKSRLTIFSKFSNIGLSTVSSHSK